MTRLFHPLRCAISPQPFHMIICLCAGSRAIGALTQSYIYTDQVETPSWVL